LDDCTFEQLQEYAKQLMRTEELTFTGSSMRHNDEVEIIMDTVYAVWYYTNNI